MANISQTANERSLRSVFVGNIPYDASEEKLKDIFSEAGPVLSFKLVYDRESGKPKGYGFCEYRDQETALSAMRNLNSYELNGRNLRVDTATNERFKEEIKNLQMSLSGSTFESPYGPEIDPDRTPEQIAKVVTSLPPEQMFEIAKQMKHCALTNPNEARNMLLQNPQLAYALLQMLVVMRAVDVQTASSILYKPNPPPMPIPPGNVGPVPGQMAGHPGHMVMQPPIPQQQQQPPPNPQMMQPPIHPQMYDDYNRGMPPQQQQPPVPPNFDQRHLDPRLRQNESRAQEMFVDPRIVAAQQSAAAQAVPPPVDPRLRQAIDPRHMSQQQQQQQQQPPPPPQQGISIRGPTPNPVGPTSTITGSRIGPPSQPMFQPPPQSNFGQPPPAAVPSSTGALPGSMVPTTVPSVPTTTPSASGSQPSGSQQQQPQQQPQPSSSMNQSEQEKAQLIMQVLSLSDQQINMLPADQRQSILALRQQLQQQNK